MQVAYITEMNFQGQKIPRSYRGMKTEIAWPCTLQADCYTFGQKPNKQYDLGLIVIPKLEGRIAELVKIDFIGVAKSFCKKIAIMQEGPHWFFQRYKLQDQIWYYNSLKQADILYVHNKSDINYYKGITDHSDIRILPTLMIEDSIDSIPEEKRSGTMIGGNFVEWYGGFDSYMVASAISDKIYSPTMGQRKEGESQLGISQLPYVDWVDWIKELNKRKYAVHLMRTHAAGTFALNCAYLGIPCIGYKGLDTQEICHPDLSVELGDVNKAKELVVKLKENNYFYNECSAKAKENYLKYYHEDKFNTTWKKQFKVS